MIVKNNKDGALTFTIPETLTTLELSPNWNEVPNEKWSLLRPHILRYIDSGTVEEFLIEVSSKDVPNDLPEALKLEGKKDKAKFLVPATIRQIDNKGRRLSTLVSDTFHLPTLQAWLDTDDRADNRSEIIKQMESIKSGNYKKIKKL